MSETAARARAARAFAGLKQKELADLLEVDEQTVKRTEAGKREPAGPELAAIADHCGVPRWFLARGWAGGQVTDEIPGVGPRLANDLRDAMRAMLDEELELRGVTRATKAALGEALDAADAAETEADASTRGGADASQEAHQPLAEETPRTAEQTGG